MMTTIRGWFARPQVKESKTMDNVTQAIQDINNGTSAGALSDGYWRGIKEQSEASLTNIQTATLLLANQKALFEKDRDAVQVQIDDLTRRRDQIQSGIDQVATKLAEHAALEVRVRSQVTNAGQMMGDAT